MSSSDIISSAGVFLILAAFFLTTFSFINSKSKIYFLLNLLGAGFACWGSVLIHSVPFTLLEATWVIVSLVGILKREKNAV